MLSIIGGLAGPVLDAFLKNSKTGTSLRHGLTTVGGALVGISTQDVGQLGDLAMQIEAVIGGAMALLGIWASLRARFAKSAVK